MKTVVEYLRVLASNGEDIIDDQKIKKLIEYLVNYFNLSSYVDNIKTQYFPIKPGTKTLYDIEKKRIEYFMWPIISESESLGNSQLDEYNRALYISLNLLVIIRYEIEIILEIYLKSKNLDNFESSLLHILLRTYKLYLKNDLSKKQNDDLYIMERLYQKNSDICPINRLAYYEAYHDVLGYLEGSEPVKDLLESDYKKIMDQAYMITSTPTMDYIKKMHNHGLISEKEEEHLINLSASERDYYKYGLIIPK